MNGPPTHSLASLPANLPVCSAPLFLPVRPAGLSATGRPLLPFYCVHALAASQPASPTALKSVLFIKTKNTAVMTDQIHVYVKYRILRWLRKTY
jgi:hypothetical protein